MFSVHILCGGHAVALACRWFGYFHRQPSPSHQGLPFSFPDRIPGKLDLAGSLGLVRSSGVILGEGVLQAVLQIIMGFLCRNVPVGAETMTP